MYRKNHRTYNLYQCECGNQKILQKNNVNSGDTKSCGCLLKEVARENLKNMPEYLKKKGGRKKGVSVPSSNKGKIRIIEDGKRRYITEGELAAMFWGINGSIESLKKRNAPNRGKTLVNGHYEIKGKNGET